MGPKKVRLLVCGSPPLYQEDAPLHLPVIYSPISRRDSSDKVKEASDDDEIDDDDDGNLSMNNNHDGEEYDSFDDKPPLAGCKATGAASRSRSRKGANLRQRLHELGQKIRDIQSLREKLKVKLPSARTKKQPHTRKLGGGFADEGVIHSTNSSVTGSVLTGKSKATHTSAGSGYSTASSRRYGGLFHPQLEIVFGEVVNSPYLTPPLGKQPQPDPPLPQPDPLSSPDPAVQYPRSTLDMHATLARVRAQLVEMQVSYSTSADRALLAAKGGGSGSSSSKGALAAGAGAGAAVASLLPYDVDWAHRRFRAIR